MVTSDRRGTIAVGEQSLITMPPFRPDYRAGRPPAPRRPNPSTAASVTGRPPPPPPTEGSGGSVRRRRARYAGAWQLALSRVQSRRLEAVWEGPATISSMRSRRMSHRSQRSNSADTSFWKADVFEVRRKRSRLLAWVLWGPGARGRGCRGGGGGVQRSIAVGRNVHLDGSRGDTDLAARARGRLQARLRKGNLAEVGATPFACIALLGALIVGEVVARATLWHKPSPRWVGIYLLVVVACALGLVASGHRLVGVGLVADWPPEGRELGEEGLLRHRPRHLDRDRVGLLVGLS